MIQDREQPRADYNKCACCQVMVVQHPQQEVDGWIVLPNSQWHICPNCHPVCSVDKDYMEYLCEHSDISELTAQWYGNPLCAAKSN